MSTSALQLRSVVRIRSGVEVAVAVFTVGVIALGALATENADALDLDVVRLAAWLSWPVAAAVLLDLRPRLPLGLVMAVIGLAPTVVVVAAGLRDGPLPTVAEALRDAPHLLTPAIALILVAVPLSFPGPWPADARGRQIGAASASCAVVGVAAAVLAAGPQHHVAAHALRRLDQLGLALVVPLSAAAFTRQVRRHRVGHGVERNRAGWFLAGTVAVALAGAASVLLDELVGPAAGSYAAAAATAAAPVGLATLVLRTDISPVSRVLLRAAVLGVAVAVVFLCYVVAFLFLRTTSLPDARAAATTVTVLASLAVLPAYARLRDSVMGRKYGVVHRPRSAMELLGRSVSSADVADALDAAAVAVAAAVRSPGAWVRIADEGDRPFDPDAAVLPLDAGNGTIGTLVVEPRRPGQAFTRADLALLDVLATPVAQVARAALLTRELDIARRDAVEQRLDERRRLRRGLHDSVGPLLAGVGLHVDAARRSAPADLRPALDRVSAAVRECRQEVRRIVDELEPAETPVPDLEGAVRELVSGWSSATVDTGLTIALVVAEQLPPFDEATRTAAYRIVGEALTNAVRHAGAHVCTVSLSVDHGALVVDVRDDGVGIGVASDRNGGRVGFGIRSMDERARMLGGELTVAPADGTRGTAVRARLPVGP